MSEEVSPSGRPPSSLRPMAYDAGSDVKVSRPSESVETPTAPIPKLLPSAAGPANNGGGLSSESRRGAPGSAEAVTAVAAKGETKGKIKSAMLSVVDGGGKRKAKRKKNKVQPFTTGDVPDGFVWDYRTASKDVASQAAAANTNFKDKVNERPWFYPMVEYGSFYELQIALGFTPHATPRDSSPEKGAQGDDGRPLWQTILAMSGSAAVNPMDAKVVPLGMHPDDGGLDSPGTPAPEGTLGVFRSTSFGPPLEPADPDMDVDEPSFNLKRKQDVFKRGDVGENVLHWCLLNSSHLDSQSQVVPERDGIPRAMAAWLIEEFGTDLINVPYQTRTSGYEGYTNYGLYEGETIVHIALVKRDHEILRLLLRKGADLRARAVGKFFSPKGPCYYGEYPLSFAVSIGESETVNEILLHVVERARKNHAGSTSKVADLLWKEKRLEFAKQQVVSNRAVGEAVSYYVNELRDSAGNTCLHMAVYHGQTDIFNELVDDWGADSTVVNSQGLTPLTLAARLSNHRMFQQIYSRQCHQMWEFGPAVGFTMPLRELDTVQVEQAAKASEVVSLRKSSVASSTDGGSVYDDDGGDGMASKESIVGPRVVGAGGIAASGAMHSALRIITRVGDLEMVTDEMVITLLGRKWELFARAHFYFECFCYVVLAILLFALSEEHRSALKKGEESDEMRSNVVTALEVLVFLGTLAVTGLELYDYITLAGAQRHERVITGRARRACAEFKKPPPVWSFDMEQPAQAFDEARWAESNAAAHKLRRKAERSMGFLGEKWKWVNDVLEDYVQINFEQSASVLSEHPDNGFLVLVRWLFCGLIVTHFFIWATWAWGNGNDRNEAGQQITLGLGTFFGWLYLLHYLQGFRRYGVLVIAIIRILLGPTLTFSVVFLVILNAFSLAFYTLGVDPADNLRNPFYGLFTVFRMSLGEPGFFEASFVDVPNEGTVITLYILFKILLILVAAKILIAMMGSTFTSVVETADKEWRLHWARVILTIERRLPRGKRVGLYRLGVPDAAGEHHYVFEKVLVPEGSSLVD